MRLRAALAALLLALPLAAVGSGAAHAAESPLTAAFAGVPSAHDGVSPFSFDLVFSEPASVGYKTLRDDSFDVVGGSVTRARRVDGRSDRWRITVAPDVPTLTDAVGDVSIELAATSDCDDDGAVCTADDAKALSNTATATVAAPPPLVAAFESVPATHDTSAAFSFRLRFDTAVTTSYRILGGSAFDVAGGEVTGARRVEGRSDLWQITIQPDTVGDDTVDDDITITLPATTDCGDADAVCTVALRPLSEPVTASVEGPLVEAVQSSERGQRVTRGVPGDKEDEEEDRVGVRAAPDPPWRLRTVGDDTELDLWWRAPLDNGGSAITGYGVQYKLASSSTWLESTHTGTDRTHTITGLDNYALYDVRVQTINADGSSGWTVESGRSAAPREDLTSDNTNPRGVTGNDDTVWVLDATDDHVYAYTRSTWAADDTKDIDLVSDNGQPTGLCMSDGFFWVPDSTFSRRKVYAYDASTRAHSTSRTFNLHSDNVSPGPVTCTDTTIWVVDFADDTLYAYNASDGTRDDTKDIEYATHVTSEGGVGTDGTHMWIADTSATTAEAFTLAGARQTDLDISYGSAGTTGAPALWADGTNMWIANGPAGSIYYLHQFPIPTASVAVAPGVPTSVASTGGSDGSVTVTWEVPASDGGTAITSYDVRYKKTADDDVAASWSTQTQSDPSTRSFTISGLDLGVSYDVQVRADNGTDGEWSTSATAETGHDFALETARPYDLTSDGTTVWVTDGTTRIVKAYSLSNGALDDTKDFETVAANDNPTGICWSNDSFWVAESGSTKVYSYATNGTRQATRDITLPTGTEPRGLYCGHSSVNSVDDTLYVVDDTTDTILNYARESSTDAWERSLFGGDVDPSSASGSDDPIGVWFDPETAGLSDIFNSVPVFVSGVSDNKVFAHGTFSVERFRDVEFLVSRNGEPAGIWSDGTTMWVLDRASQVAYGYRLPLGTDGGPDPRIAEVATDGLSVLVTFSESLDRTVKPAASAFEVTAGLDTFTPSSVAHSAHDFVGGVTLSFAPALPAGATMTIAYTAPPSTDPAIQDAGGVVAASFDGFKMANRPTVPQNVAAAPGDTSLTVSWEAPAADGGRPVAGYLVRQKRSTATTWTTVSFTDASALSATITGLTNELAYDVQVTASNLITLSSAAVASATPSAGPLVEVEAGSADSTFKATDNKSGSTTWHYAWIAGTAVCDSTTTFPDMSNYTEGANLTYTATQNTNKACFRSTEGTNSGYAVSEVVNTNAASSDATLSALTLVEGSTSVSLSPTFASGTTEYRAWVANGVSSVTVTATKNDDGASVAITDDSDTSTPGTAVLSLEEGANTVTVTVTAADTTTTGTYTITAVREASAPTADPTALLTAKMTAGQDGTDDIYGYQRVGANYGALTGNEFDFDGTTETITNLFWNGPSGDDTLVLDRLYLCLRLLPSNLDYDLWTLRVGSDDYRLADGQRVGTTQCVRWARDDPWAHGELVTVKMFGNHAATGAPGVSGTAQVGQTLTASREGIADLDGTTEADDGELGFAYEYQWVRVDSDGTNPVDISGATSVTYVPVKADVGKKVMVKVTFTDDRSNEEELTSAAYPAAGRILNDVPPMLDTATVNGVLLVLTYDRELDGDSDPAVGLYTVTVAGTDVTPTGVDAAGRTVTLTLATAVTSGQSVTLDYMVPAMDPVQDSDGTPAGALDGQAVHNVVGDTTAPTLGSARVDGDVLVLSYSEALDSGSEPAVGQFDVQVTPSGGSASRRNVSTVDVSGSKVTLTLASAVDVTDSVTLDYDKPTSNPLQDVAGNDAAELSGRSVGNASDVCAAPDLAGREQVWTAEMTVGSSIGVFTSYGFRADSSPPFGSLSDDDFRIGTTNYEVGQLFNTAGIAPFGDRLTFLVDNPVPDMGTVLHVCDESFRLAAALLDQRLDGESTYIWSNAGLDWSAVDMRNVYLSVTPPQLDSATVNRTQLELEFSRALDTGSVPSNSDFNVQVTPEGGVAARRSVTDVAISASTATLTLVSAVLPEDTVTVQYSGQALRDTTSIEVRAFDGEAVENDTPDTTAPILESHTVSASTVTLTYNEALDEGSVPASSAFVVNVTPTGGTAQRRDVTGVVVDGVTVRLTLVSPVASGDTVTVVYTVPASGPIQDQVGNDAAAIDITIELLLDQTGVCNLALQDSGRCDLSTATTLTAGVPLEADVAESNDVDWFRVNLEEDTVYRIDMEGAPTGKGDLLDPYLRGMYAVFAGSALGGYRDDGLLDDDGEDIETIWYSLQGDCATNGDPPADCKLFDEGTYYNDDGGVGYNARLYLRGFLPGTHYVEARGLGPATGTYTITLTEVTDDFPDDDPTLDLPTLTLSEETSATIDFPDDSDTFDIYLTANTEYTITLRAQGWDGWSDIDIDSAVHTGTDGKVDTDYDGLTDTYTIEPDTTGTHEIKIVGRNWGRHQRFATGSYTITVTAGS